VRPVDERHSIEQKQFFRHREKLLETRETAHQFQLAAGSPNGSGFPAH
jgi:hypothetical protein